MLRDAESYTSSVPLNWRREGGWGILDFNNVLEPKKKNIATKYLIYHNNHFNKPKGKYYMKGKQSSISKVVNGDKASKNGLCLFGFHQ